MRRQTLDCTQPVPALGLQERVHALTLGENGVKWKVRGWYLRPKTAVEVMQVLGRIGVYSSGQQYGWRGLSSIDFDVSSSLQRSLGPHATEADVRAAENDILRRARDWGLGVGEYGEVDDLHLLADLQHYGIPTRLIDFTSNPMTALWFACQAAPNSDTDSGRRLAKSGVVLALNITRYHRYNTVGVPWGVWEDGSLRVGSAWRIDEALGSGKPFVVEQSVPNSRLRAQEGFFVTGPLPKQNLALSLENAPFVGFEVEARSVDPDDLHERLAADRARGAPRPLPFVGVIISAGLKPKLLRYLGASYNRSARTLFPDYQGFGAYGVPSLTRMDRPRSATDPRDGHSAASSPADPA